MELRIAVVFPVECSMVVVVAVAVAVVVVVVMVPEQVVEEIREALHWRKDRHSEHQGNPRRHLHSKIKRDHDLLQSIIH